MYSNFVLGVTVAVIVISILTYIYRIPPVEKMANNGLLFISNATKAHSVCSKATSFVKKVLYVKIKESPEVTLPVISRQINNVYSKATSNCGNLDVRLMLKSKTHATKISTYYPVDVILYEAELAKGAERLSKSVVTAKADCRLQCIDTRDIAGETPPTQIVKTYEHVALGGTFDRLHNGHKILLSEAALRSTRHVTVGVADINMLQTKKLWELIEPIEHRMKVVHDFLKDINPDLQYNVFPLQDLYGPTKDDPSIQLLIVSEETMKGGIKINEKRKENHLKPLDIHEIGLAADSYPQKPTEEEEKMSSSNVRLRLLGTMLREPVENTKIPKWPYVIGLAGGIASGKSNIANKLQREGAAMVNCDLIAHELYKAGTPLNRTISKTFGDDVITAAGEVDRKKLGQIVFSDENKLNKLNSILWPAILEEAQRRILSFGKQGYKVVVMEAAVMVRAKWYEYCHQLWAVIVPPDEAVKRMQQRNNLSEEEARQRLASQPSNSEQIAFSNVVFSPTWSYDYTQEQINRAWATLQEYLNKRK